MSETSQRQLEKESDSEEETGVLHETGHVARRTRNGRGQVLSNSRIGAGSKFGDTIRPRGSPENKKYTVVSALLCCSRNYLSEDEDSRMCSDVRSCSISRMREQKYSSDSSDDSDDTESRASNKSDYSYKSKQICKQNKGKPMCCAGREKDLRKYSPILRTLRVPSRVSEEKSPLSSDVEPSVKSDASVKTDICRAKETTNDSEDEEKPEGKGSTEYPLSEEPTAKELVADPMDNCVSIQGILDSFFRDPNSLQLVPFAEPKKSKQAKNKILWSISEITELLKTGKSPRKRSLKTTTAERSKALSEIKEIDSIESSGVFKAGKHNRRNSYEIGTENVSEKISQRNPRSREDRYRREPTRTCTSERRWHRNSSKLGRRTSSESSEDRDRNSHSRVSSLGRSRQRHPSKSKRRTRSRSIRVRYRSNSKRRLENLRMCLRKGCRWRSRSSRRLQNKSQQRKHTAQQEHRRHCTKETQRSKQHSKVKPELSPPRYKADGRLDTRPAWCNRFMYEHNL